MVFPEERIRETQSGPMHTPNAVFTLMALGQEPQTFPRWQPQKTPPHLLHRDGWETGGGAAQDSSSDAWNLRISMYLVSKPWANREVGNT